MCIRDRAKLHPQIVVKIPMILDGVKALKYFSNKGIRTNCTLIFSVGQALIAAKAGATYVSPFIGRLDDISTDGLNIISEIANVYDNYAFNTQILAASVRHTMHIIDCAKIGADVMTGSSHKTFPGPQGGFILSSSEDEKFQRRLNNAVFPGTCSSYHLHHVAGKVIALAEFMEYGHELSKNTVKNAQAFGAALAAEGFDVLAESRGYTASHQVLTRHGELDSGAGAKAAKLLEDAGIITNMNMLPGDTKAMTPSGLRLGVQELTRVGMGTDEMQDIASFYSRVLLKGEDPASVKNDVREFKSNYQVIRYCFNEDEISGYPL